MTARSTLKLCKCAGCGKKFLPAPYHDKSKRGLYCTYNCMVSAEKKHEEDLKVRKSEGRNRL